MSDTDSTPTVLDEDVADESPVAEADDEPEWSEPATSRYESWSTLALVTALLGLVPLTWEVPILSLLAVVFGLVGLHQCELDSSKSNRWMAVVGLGVGLATLALVVVLTGLKHVALLPFWTGQ